VICPDAAADRYGESTQRSWWQDTAQKKPEGVDVLIGSLWRIRLDWPGFEGLKIMSLTLCRMKFF